MTIIRKAADIREATTADLVETYNHFTPHAPIKKFENRTVAERRVEMALLAATDRAAHAGVPRGQAPTPKAPSELPPAPVAAPAAEPPAPQAASAANPYPAGSKRAALFEQMRDKVKPVARPKVEKRPADAPRARKVTHVVVTGAGLSKLQAGSQRAAVLATLQRMALEAGGGPVALEDAAKQLDFPIGGHVQKLIAVKHLAAHTPAA